METHPHAAASEPTERLPIIGLLALATAAFVTILTEVMPAGLLTPIAVGLDISESQAGQFITAFAAGALLAALPITSLTRSLRRRPLLIAAIAGFGVINLITAVSQDYTVTLVARFFAGICGGLVWSLLAGYAVRMSPPQLSGRAIAVVSAGTTVALVLGLPLASLLGRAIGWQGSFGLMTILSAVLIVWMLAAVPDFPGQGSGERESLARVLRRPGIATVLLIVLGFVLAYNILYIYIQPFLRPAGLADRIESVLLTFGIGSMVGLWVVGLLIDRRLPVLGVASTAGFAAASLLLAWRGDSASIVYPAIAIWGLSVGGFATITQTALARFAGPSVDVAQATYTTGWNTAVAGGGIAGGVLLGQFGPGSLPVAVVALLVPVLFLMIFGMRRALARQG